MPDIRNDSGLPVEEVIERLENAVEISYGNLRLRIKRHLVDEAREQVASMPPDAKQQMMQAIDRALRRNIPKLETGKVSKKRSDETVSDLILWYVLRGN
jgi:vacuolar-type H+-ATPase subunit C/Vma6